MFPYTTTNRMGLHWRTPPFPTNLSINCISLSAKSVQQFTLSCTSFTALILHLNSSNSLSEGQINSLVQSFALPLCLLQPHRQLLKVLPPIFYIFCSFCCFSPFSYGFVTPFCLSLQTYIKDKLLDQNG